MALDHHGSAFYSVHLIHLCDISASYKSLSFTSQNNRLDISVVLYLFKSACKFIKNIAVKGIHCLRAVDCDISDTIFYFEFNVFVHIRFLSLHSSNGMILNILLVISISFSGDRIKNFAKIFTNLSIA